MISTSCKMSSSDSSSEDEEEAKRISQAIIPNDFLPSISSKTSVPSAAATKSTETKQLFYERTHKTIGINNQKDSNLDIPLKSKRSDKTEEDQYQCAPLGYFLKTTPEFRAYVEKHLSQALDKEIDAQIRCGAWKDKNIIKNKGNKDRGVKLFSHDKTLCLGEDVIPIDDGPKTKPKIQRRKHKLNASSESSEEEEDKIQSCVFSLEDICHENKMLEDLSKSGVTAEMADASKTGKTGTPSKPGKTGTPGKSGTPGKPGKRGKSAKPDRCEEDEGDDPGSKDKKKKRKKRTSENDVDEADSVIIKAKKKKKKKDKTSNEEVDDVS